MRFFVRSRFFPLVVLVGLWNSSASGQALEVYLFGGQSNQQGIAEISDLPSQALREMPRVLYWTGDDFERLRPGVTQTSFRPTEFGPEIGFALTYVAEREDGRIAIIKHGRSGTALSAGWADQDWRGDTLAPGRSNFYPGESDEDPNRGTAYIEMIEHYSKALAALDDAEVDYVVKGIIWVQGEQDSKNEISASRYAKNISRLVMRIHEDLHLSGQSVPLFFAQSLGLPPSGLVPGTGRRGDQPNRFISRDTIRKSMQNADADSGHADAIRNAHMISTDGLPLKDDVHYDAAGQLELGRRFFAAVERFRQTTTRED